MSAKERVLGIDPGTRHTGWGVIAIEGNRLRLVEAGIIDCPPKAPLEERLRAIHSGIEAVIQRLAPTAVAVEDVFFAKYPNAALKLGHARGVALLAASQASLAVTAYPPSLVKRSVVGKGRAGKEQVARIVGVILGLRELPGPDATDALAVAITHAQALRVPHTARR